MPVSTAQPVAGRRPGGNPAGTLSVHGSNGTGYSERTEVERVLAAVRAIDTSRIRTKGDRRDVVEQLVFQQKRIVRLCVAAEPPSPLAGLVELRGEGDECLAWERMTKAMEPRLPALPRADETTRILEPREGLPPLHRISTNGEAKNTKARSAAVLEMLLDMLGGPTVPIGQHDEPEARILNSDAVCKAVQWTFDASGDSRTWTELIGGIRSMVERWESDHADGEDESVDAALDAMDFPLACAFLVSLHDYVMLEGRLDHHALDRAPALESRVARELGPTLTPEAPSEGDDEEIDRTVRDLTGDVRATGALRHMRSLLASTKSTRFPVVRVEALARRALRLVESHAVGPVGPATANRKRRSMPWEVARQTAEAIVKADGWPSSRERLRERVRCNIRTLTKAIENSPLLQQAERASKGDRGAAGGGDELARLTAEQAKDNRSRHVQ